MSRFSPSVLRCFGAATIEASMIWPLIARNPAAESTASKRSNTTSIAGLPASLARVSASRKVQIVLASGTVSESPKPRKRMNDSRSRIRYSVRSSDRLWLACSTSVLNISTWSKGGRPPFARSERGTARSRSARNNSKSTTAFSRSPSSDPSSGLSYANRSSHPTTSRHGATT